MRVPISAARRAAILAAVCCTAAVPALGQSPKEAWTAVDRAVGRPGTSQPGDVQKYSFPRSDLRVRAGGVELKPALALGSWVALKRMSGSGGRAMAMGDLVLLETEVAPVISKLQSMGGPADGPPQPPAARIAVRDVPAHPGAG